MQRAAPTIQPVGHLVLMACTLPLVPIVPLMASFRPHSIAFRVLHEFAHAPVFGALAVVIFELLRRRTSLPTWAATLLAFVLAVAIGGFVELVQPALGRSGEYLDLQTDALGAAAGLATAALFSSRRHWMHVIVLIIAAYVVLKPVVEMTLAYGERYRQFPELLEISSRFDLYFLSTDDLEIAWALLPEKWRHDEDPLSLKLTMTGGGLPGLAQVEPAQDWRGYTRLMIDLTNPGVSPLALTLRVHDREHDNQAEDRFNTWFVLPGGSRTVLAIPIAQIKQAPVSRELDISRIAGVMIFGRREQAHRGRIFYLTRVWLES